MCSAFGVCGVVDTYGAPFAERQCRCPPPSDGDRRRRRRNRRRKDAGAALSSDGCSLSASHRDGHTVVDKTRQYKVRMAFFVIERLSLSHTEYDNSRTEDEEFLLIFFHLSY